MMTAAEMVTGVAREGNPVLRDVIARSPLAGVFFKVIVVVLVSVGIWRLRRYRQVLAIALLALALYAAVLAYHFGFLSGLGLLSGGREARPGGATPGALGA